MITLTTLHRTIIPLPCPSTGCTGRAWGMVPGWLSAMLILLAMAQSAMCQDHCVWSKGGIIRMDTTRMYIYLAFTGADHADGADDILATLRRERIRGNFFLTGSFVERHPETVGRMADEGHYVGSHSYGHLLYSPWDRPDSTTVTHEEFCHDVRLSYAQLSPFGIDMQNAPVFMPPYEHYNDTISLWARQMGLQVVCFTPGSTSNADYTTPDMKNYRSSATIYGNILSLEESKGLNGHIMLFHLGTVKARTDKFYRKHLRKLIRKLKQRGYGFGCFREEANP